MQKVIYKQKLDIGPQHIELPSNTTILHVGLQDDVMYMWYSCPRESHRSYMWEFNVRGTGHPYLQVEEGEYFGTIQRGVFVWHIFGGII